MSLQDTESSIGSERARADKALMELAKIEETNEKKEGEFKRLKKKNNELEGEISRLQDESAG